MYATTSLVCIDIPKGYVFPPLVAPRAFQTTCRQTLFLELQPCRKERERERELPELSYKSYNLNSILAANAFIYTLALGVEKNQPPPPLLLSSFSFLSFTLAFLDCVHLLPFFFSYTKWWRLILRLLWI